MGANLEAITQRIGLALRDANADSWTESGIQDAIFEAEKVIVSLRPDAFAVSTSHTLAAGSKQSIAALTNPAPHRLLEVECNVVDGNPSRAISRAARGDLDRIRPNWRAATQSALVKEYVFDDRYPLEYEVNPPAQAAIVVRVVYSGTPAAYGTVDSNTETSVSDIYEPHLMEWSLYRLFGHDTEHSVNVSRSQAHLGNFNAMMGIKLQGEKTQGPKNMEHKR